MEHRDRATGWQHAKLSGHKNEDLVKMRLDADEEFATSLLKRINQPHAHIAHTTIGGLHETNVPSVNGRKTKSKTDLKVYLDTAEIINISIKKSLHGQVYLSIPLKSNSTHRSPTMYAEPSTCFGPPLMTLLLSLINMAIRPLPKTMTCSCATKA